jgi:prepilin-type N-terminal cleavage/methylation domain-containing protein
MSGGRAVRRRRRSSGFTLIELIVACALSSIVLIGMFSITTNMVAAEVNGMRTGTVTAWTIASIGAMNADISGAGAIGYPTIGAPTQDFLTVCTNWSSKLAVPAAIDNTVGNTVTIYCYDTTDPAPFANSILRSQAFHVGPGSAVCPVGVPPLCTSANYGGASSIVATGVYRDAAPALFNRDPKTMNAVRLRFVVGNPLAGNSAGSNPATNTQTPVPVSVPFNTEIILED